MNGSQGFTDRVYDFFANLLGKITLPMGLAWYWLSAFVVNAFLLTDATDSFERAFFYFLSVGPLLAGAHNWAKKNAGSENGQRAKLSWMVSLMVKICLITFLIALAAIFLQAVF